MRPATMPTWPVTDTPRATAYRATFRLSPKAWEWAFATTSPAGSACCATMAATTGILPATSARARATTWARDCCSTGKATIPMPAVGSPRARRRIWARDCCATRLETTSTAAAPPPARPARGTWRSRPWSIAPAMTPTAQTNSGWARRHRTRSRYSSMRPERIDTWPGATRKVTAARPTTTRTSTGSATWRCSFPGTSRARLPTPAPAKTDDVSNRTRRRSDHRLLPDHRTCPPRGLVVARPASRVRPARQLQIRRKPAARRHAGARRDRDLAGPARLARTQPRRNIRRVDGVAGRRRAGGPVPDLFLSGIPALPAIRPACLHDRAPGRSRPQRFRGRSGPACRRRPRDRRRSAAIRLADDQLQQLPRLQRLSSQPARRHRRPAAPLRIHFQRLFRCASRQAQCVTRSAWILLAGDRHASARLSAAGHVRSHRHAAPDRAPAQLQQLDSRPACRAVLRARPSEWNPDSGSDGYRHLHKRGTQTKLRA